MLTRRTHWMSLSAAAEQTSDVESIPAPNSIVLSASGREEVLRRRPTGDSGSWHRSPRRPQHESDGIRVSYPILAAALASVSDLCRARLAHWADHLLVIEQRSLRRLLVCRQICIAERAVLHFICVVYIAGCLD